MLLINFGLIEKRNTPFAKLSHGMKRALTIAAALAHTPSLVFLDEPTTGLDVLNARKLRKMISSLREEGVTVFLTTHYLEEAERLCDRIGLIVRGKLIALDTVAGLKARVQDKGMSRVEISWKDEFNALKSAEIEGVSADDAIRKALMLTQGFEIMSINTQLPSMEDVFVQLTGLNAEAMLAEKGNGKGN
jgi:ABC-2 type transport system ATP-binding protein